MPKERKVHQSRASPYPTNSSSVVPSPPKTPPSTKDTKEWDEIRCPICLEYPHNAVLLKCSSITDGCHPFICNTSQRHSNCLDQFRNMTKQMYRQPGKPNYSCPLCRGEVTGQVIVPNTRHYLNKKVRSCSKESCGFAGTYKALRKHAWEEHPMVHPSEPDPERQSEWMRMEQRSDFRDLVSTMRSSTENGDDDDDTEFTGIVRVPSMSIVVIVRITSSRVSTRSIRSETIIDDNDGGDNVDQYNDGSDCDDDDDGNDGGDDGSDGDESDGDEGDVDDFIRNRQARRRPRRRLIISDDEMDGGADA